MSDDSGSTCMLIDSHCHLDYLTRPPHELVVDEIVRSAGAAGVGRMLSVAVDRHDLVRVLEQAAMHPEVYAAIGIHPSTAEDASIEAAELLRLAANPRVVAIGEIGLDYHYGADSKELQRERFVMQLEVAARAGLPVIVHTREAREDTLELLEHHADRSCAGVMHCFTESIEMARAALALNFMISFSGIITFRNAAALREVVREIPLDRLLVETDSPYLAPVPYRGKVNEPRHVIHVVRAIADIRGISPDEVAQATTANFMRLFRRAAVIEGGS